MSFYNLGVLALRWSRKIQGPLDETWNNLKCHNNNNSIVNDTKNRELLHRPGCLESSYMLWKAEENLENPHAVNTIISDYLISQGVSRINYDMRHERESLIVRSRGQMTT